MGPASLVDKLRGDEIRSLRNQVEDGLRDHVLKTLDERGRAQELIRQQYSGRYPFELLQNANDANADRGGSGNVLFAVTDEALIVADDGAGFGEDQIRAICGLGRSSKDARKSIGYKGLGFKSVGEISERPQVLSGEALFGFDPHRTVEAVQEIAGTLDATQRLPVYAFPFNLELSALGSDVGLVNDLRARGFTTVVRFPFLDGARPTVEEHVRQTITPRLLLFLDATDCIEIRGTSEDFVATVVREESDAFVETLLSVGDRTEHWLVVRRGLTELNRSLIDPLGDAWRTVDQVHVAVAIPLGDDNRPVHQQDEPAHVYFPTEERTGLPIVLQGDFVLELDRRHFARSPESLPYNQWLASELADLVATAAEALAERFPDDEAVVAVFAPSAPSSGFGDYLLQACITKLRGARFVPGARREVLRPVDAQLLPATIPDPETAHRFMAIDERFVAPLVELHAPSRALLSDVLGVSSIDSDAALRLIREPHRRDDEQFYEFLVSWARHESLFSLSLRSVASVRTIGGDWVTPESGVFFPRQRDEVIFPDGLHVPIARLPDVVGLRPVLEEAGVRPFEWRQLLPEFVLPILKDPNSNADDRTTALGALREYFNSERTGDARILNLISESLLPCRDAAGAYAGLAEAGRLYFSSDWLGQDHLERIYGPFNQIEFLAVERPVDAGMWQQDFAFYEWMGVSARPRIDEHRAEQRDHFDVNHLARHPHGAFGTLWESWVNSAELQRTRTCDQGHSTSQQLKVSFALDRFPQLVASGDIHRLRLLWGELSTNWSSYQATLNAVVQCNHGWHTGGQVRLTPSLFQFMLREVEWIPCVRAGKVQLACPRDAWRVTTDTPARIAQRVNVLMPGLDAPDSAQIIATLGVVDAARPQPEHLRALLRDLEQELATQDPEDDVKDVQFAARWAMRTLNEVLGHGFPLDGPVPLLARLDGNHIFSESPLVANDPLLADTWEPVFPILDADRDLRRLYDAMQLRRLDEEVVITPRPLRPRPDLRLSAERWLHEAKPYLVALVADQVPSRKDDVVRGLLRLEVSVCDELVLQYELDGAVRERAEATTFIAERIEREGSARRRIGTAYLEADPHSQAPYWFAVGQQLAEFLSVQGQADAFALILSADPNGRLRYLDSKRISNEAVNEARVDLAQEPDDDTLAEVLVLPEGELELDLAPAGDGPLGAGERVLTSGDESGDAAPHVDTSPTPATEAELPLIDHDLVEMHEPPELGRAPVDGGKRRSGLPGLGSEGTVDHEAQQRLQRRIGRRGEETALEAERRRQVALRRDPAVVVWRSQEYEFAPYDIESLDEDGQLIYIEVKATPSEDPFEPFEISEAQLLFALRKRTNYYIYRVTQVQTASPVVTRFADPVGKLGEGSASLRLRNARLEFVEPEG